MDTKKRIRFMSVALFLAVFTVWTLFYFVISGHIASNTERQIEIAASQIIEKLGGEFSQAEKLSYSLANNDHVQAAIAEQDPDSLYSIVDEIEQQLAAIMFNPDFIDHIIIYGTDAHYFRLSGKLGNKSCGVLANILSALTLPNHLSVNLDNKRYIGYADEIVPYSMQGESGKAVILIEEEKILEILSAYDQSGLLLVAVKANGDVVTANTDKLFLFSSERAERPVIHSRLGITPYEISVTADSAYFNASVVYFAIVALVTATIFAFVLFIYAGILNKRFFRPMIKVIGSIETLNTDEGTGRLSHVQSEEFDELIDKINEMLYNLNKKNDEIKTAEIEKQKAIIFSLKKQINAHFTINTLNAIRILVEQEELEKAETVSMGLTSLIRYAYDKDELITVWDELDILKNFIVIMNSRYNDKLNVDFDFDDRLMDYRIPRMLLQPVIENAIVHGFRDMGFGCAISVTAKLRSDTIFFTISDNGSGMGADELAGLNRWLGSESGQAQGYESIALLNIKNRLNHYYGDAGQLTIKSNASEGIEVLITIPFSVYAGEPA